MDRVFDYESKGRRFESSLAHQHKAAARQGLRLCALCGVSRKNGVLSFICPLFSLKTTNDCCKRRQLPHIIKCAGTVLICRTCAFLSLSLQGVKNIFKGFCRPCIRALYDVAVYVQRCAGLRMTQPAGHRAHVLTRRNQDRGVYMPQAM